MHLCVEDKDLRSELSAAEEKDVGYKVCMFFVIVIDTVIIIFIHIVTMIVAVLVISDFHSISSRNVLTVFSLLHIKCSDVVGF